MGGSSKRVRISSYSGRKGSIEEYRLGRKGSIEEQRIDRKGSIEEHRIGRKGVSKSIE